jgi:hypothetical protein
MTPDHGSGIVPILDLIDPALTEEELKMPQLGLVERCKKAWDGSRTS